MIFVCEYCILFIARTQIDEYPELNEQLSSFAWCHQSQTVLISKFHARTSYGVITVLQLTSTLVLDWFLSSSITIIIKDLSPFSSNHVSKRMLHLTQYVLNQMLRNRVWMCTKTMFTKFHLLFFFPLNLYSTIYSLRRQLEIGFSGVEDCNWTFC